MIQCEKIASGKILLSKFTHSMIKAAAVQLAPVWKAVLRPSLIVLDAMKKRVVTVLISLSFQTFIPIIPTFLLFRLQLNKAKSI